ncbi:MAG: MFS transporter [Patescibacteria group bacterium]
MFQKINLDGWLNKIIRYLIISDLLLWSGWGVIDPIFSIFVIENIAGATLISVGLLATIYWGVKSIAQIPISIILDKNKGEKDDFYMIIAGMLIAGVSAFSFVFAKELWQVYLIQFFKGLGFALYLPSWMAMFSRHLDKKHAAFDWALNSSSVGIGIGLAGIIGGSIASLFGFKSVFIATSLFAILSAIILLFVRKSIITKNGIEIKFHNHK